MTSRDSLPRGLILQHEGFKSLLNGRLLTAPVAEPIGRVLDIGTGCGIWAAEFATEHPSADVIGVDVFPQPTIDAPPNCQFIIRDAEQEWDFGGDKFDVIHTRLVPFHEGKVRAVLQRCYSHLKPGGCMEMQEAWPPYRTDAPSDASDHGSKIIEWTKLRADAAAKLGVNHGIAGELPELLSEAGFAPVQTHDLKWPVGPWMDDPRMKEAGNINLELLRLSMQGLSKDLLQEIGMKEQQIDEFLAEVRQELGVGKIYGRVRVVWARKPVQ